MDLSEIFAQILVFAGIIFAILKFAREKKREFQKRFFEEQLKVFSEVIDYTSIILVYDRNDEEYKLANKNFKRLFWGKMCLVEDKNVETKMCKFDELLDQYNQDENNSNNHTLKNKLKEAQLNLAHTCRNSCLHTWQIENNTKGFNDYSLNR